MASVAKTVFMFSGQGSQHYQMGKALYEQPGNFREWMQKMDQLVVELSGHSVLATLYDPANGKAARFDRTALTHPAIFMIEYALAQTLIESGIFPDMVLGASLGTFAAAAVAGSLTMEEALTVVVRQAELLETHCQPGGMVAVLADPKLYETDVIRANSELAAVNFANHFAVSARQDRLEPIEAFLRERQASFQRLPVSFAFHSRWISEIEPGFMALMHDYPPRPPRFPVVCCAHGGPLDELSASGFWNVIRQPIRFRDTVACLEAAGPSRYIDAGPSGTLATLLKYALPKTTRSTVHAVMSPFGRDIEGFAAVVSSCRTAPLA